MLRNPLIDRPGSGLFAQYIQGHLFGGIRHGVLQICDGLLFSHCVNRLHCLFVDFNCDLHMPILSALSQC